MSPSNEHNGYNGRAVDWHYGDKIGTVAVIPAYNEERFIGSVVIKACKYADAVIVVDDGSSDATAEIARLAGATVIQHEQNAGKGAALSTGLRKARELHPAAVVVLDADYQHRPREIGQVTAPVLAGEADIVIGSRYLSNGSNTPTHRVWGHRVFNLMTNGASGVAVTDSQSGFRAFSPAALEAIAFRSNGFSVESEMQFIAKAQGLRLSEVPITITYSDKPKRPVLAHGMLVLNGLLRMVGQYRPLLFFGVTGLLITLLSLALGGYVVAVYQQTKTLAVGYSMITVLLAMIGILTFFTGIILHSVRGLVLNVEDKLNKKS
jgi:glycosyltransferase involved in cell wall biosynthesis